MIGAYYLFKQEEQMEYAYLSLPVPERPEPKNEPKPYPDHEQSWIIEDLHKIDDEEKKDKSSHVIVIEL